MAHPRIQEAARKPTARHGTSSSQVEPGGSLSASLDWPACFGSAACMAAAVERDAARSPAGEAARVLDYEPLAVCEDCPLPAGCRRVRSGP